MCVDVGRKKLASQRIHVAAEDEVLLCRHFLFRKSSNQPTDELIISVFCIYVQRSISCDIFIKCAVDWRARSNCKFSPANSLHRTHTILQQAAPHTSSQTLHGCSALNFSNITKGTLHCTALHCSLTHSLQTQLLLSARLWALVNDVVTSVVSVQLNSKRNELTF